MALIQCHECGQQISSEAKACPQCGAKKLRAKTGPSKTIMWVALGGVVIAMAIAGVEGDRKRNDEKMLEDAKTPEQKSAEAAAKKARNLQFARATAATAALRGSMKDPQSFALQTLSVMPDGTGCIDYRAKNTFGAIFPSSAVFTSAGKLLVQERDKNAFVAAWNAKCTKAGGTDITRTATDFLSQN